MGNLIYYICKLCNSVQEEKQEENQYNKNLKVFEDLFTRTSSDISIKSEIRFQDFENEDDNTLSDILL